MQPPFPNPPQAPTVPQSALPAGQPVDPKKDFIARYGKALKRLFDDHVVQAVDREKIYQFAKARRNDYYFRGHQHLMATFGGTGDLVDWKPVGSDMLLRSSSPDRLKNTVIYDYVLNDFRGDLRKWVAVLGSRAPNVRARPSWVSDEDATTRAALADEVAMYLRSLWDIDAANRYLALSLGKNSTSFFYTPYHSDASRLGTFDEPVWGEEIQKIESDWWECPICGERSPTPQCQTCLSQIPSEGFRSGETGLVPVQTGTKTYPNGTVDLEIHSAFTITTPFYVKDLAHCPWLWKHMEDDAGSLVERFPDRGLEEKIKSISNKSGGSTSETLGRLARVQASSPQGMGLVDRPWRWTVNDAWLRSSMYNYLLRQSDLEAEELRTKLKAEFPHGIHLAFVDGELVDYSPESLDEVWAEVKPETSEYLWADPVFDDYIQGQDIMNDAWNMFLQIMETSIPFVFYDPEVLDPAKIRTGFEINEFVPIVPGTGAQAKDGLIPSRPSELKPELIQFMAQVRGILREIVGLMPVIFGAEAGGGQMTAEEARRRLNQALLVLSTTWNEMRMGWALAFRNAVRQLAKFSLGRLVSTNGHPDSVTVKEVDRIKDLLKGGWYFECDQAIPMGWTQLRDFVSSLFKENPALAELMGASDPDNLSQVNQGIGIPGWKIPGMVRKKYMSGIIERLLKEQATPMPDGSFSPSIPFDPLQHPPEMVVPLIQNWIMENGLEQEGNPGYLNVLAFGRAAQQFMQMQMQAIPPGGPPKGSGSSSPSQPPTSEADKIPPQPEMQNAESQLPPTEPLPPEAAEGMVM